MNTLSAALTRTIAAALLVMPASLWSQTGTIRGTVRLSGSAPAPRVITVDKNPEVCGESLNARDVMVSGGNVAYAVASVEGVAGDPGEREYTLANEGCMFDPPVLATTAGGTLLVTNQDDVLHNTHLNMVRGTRTRTVGNWALSRKGAEITADRPLRRAGRIEVECDAHSWMHAQIVIFDHPYFAVSGADGAFEISDVPVGTHTVKIWHEVFGELEQSVTVEEGTAATVTFTFSP